MTIVTPRDAGALGGKMDWRQVKSDSKNFSTEHMIMQRLRPMSLLSKMKRSNKTYRILLLRTKLFRPSTSGGSASNSLIGKKWIVAESDDWKAMIKSWYKIEHYLIPMLLIPTRTYTIGEVFDLLASLEHKQIHLSAISSSSTTTTAATAAKSRKIDDGSPMFEDVEESLIDTNGYSSVTTSTTLNSQTVKASTTALVAESSSERIYDLEDAKDHMEQLQRGIGSIKSLIKNVDGSEKQRQRVLGQLSQNNGAKLNELKDVSNKLDKYLKSVPRKDIAHQKLGAQFKELSTIYQQEILRNELVVKSMEQVKQHQHQQQQKGGSNGSSSSTAPDRSQQKSSPSDSKTVTTKTSLTTTVGDGSQAQVMQKKEAQLTVSQMSTIQIEKAIALEKQKELKSIEQDLLEVHEIFRDLNELLIEQDGQIDKISNNVERATDDISVGIDDLRRARKLQNFRNVL